MLISDNPKLAFARGQEDCLSWLRNGAVIDWPACPYSNTLAERNWRDGFALEYADYCSAVHLV